MLRHMIRIGLICLALGMGGGASAQTASLPRQQCDFVAILGLMTQDLRAIGSTNDRQAQALHRRIVAQWMAMVGPRDLMAARATPTLRLHSDDMSDFLAGVSRYLGRGGAIMEIPGLARVEHMVEGVGCPLPDNPAVDRLIDARPSQANWLIRPLGALARPELLTASEQIYGSPLQRAMFLLGMSIFGVASGIMIHRNQRQRRLEQRHACHIPSCLRQGYGEHEIRIKDLSCKGAKLTRPEGVIEPTRIWLQVEGVWMSCRIAWRNAHFIGVAFDHPLSLAQLRLALKNAPPYTPPSGLRAPLRHAAKGAETSAQTGPVFHSARGKAPSRMRP